MSTSTKAQAAFLAIRDAIRTGTLHAGQPVTLQSLADQLGMSLTPVREALHQLASQGLVERRPNHGTVVTQYTRGRADEIYRLRLVLEPMAAGLAAENMTAQDLDELQGLLAELDDSIAAGRDADIPQLNARLHAKIYSGADSGLLLEFIERLWNGVPFQAISLAERKHQSALEHHAIVEALVNRDADGAAAATHAHIANAAEETLRHIDELFA